MGLDEKATGRRRGLTGPGEAGPEGGMAAAGDGVDCGKAGDGIEATVGGAGGG